MERKHRQRRHLRSRNQPDGISGCASGHTLHLRIDVLVDTRANPDGGNYSYGVFGYRQDRALRNSSMGRRPARQPLRHQPRHGRDLLTDTFDSEDDNPLSAGEVKDGWLHVEADYAWLGKEKADTPEHPRWRMEWTRVAIVALLRIIALLLLLI